MKWIFALALMSSAALAGEAQKFNTFSFGEKFFPFFWIWVLTCIISVLISNFYHNGRYKICKNFVGEK